MLQLQDRKTSNQCGNFAAQALQLAGVTEGLQVCMFGRRA
jgi:hypothetical protein